MTIHFLIVCFLVLICCIRSNDLESNEYRTKVLHMFSSQAEALKAHPMGDVLVIVHSNFNCTLEQIETYFRIWKPICPNIVFFANWDADDLHRLRKHDYPVFKCPDNDDGWLAQIVMLKALHKFQLPMFKGYLYIHDDLVVSPSSLHKFDKNKFWIADYREYQDPTKSVLPYITVQKITLEPWDKRNWGWPWFNKPKYGIETMQKIMTLYPEIEDTLKQCTDLEKNEPGSSHTWYYASGDVYYLPASYVHRFEHIVGIFSEHTLFFEIAIGTYMKCFSPAQDNKQVEMIKLCTNWESSERRADIWKWSWRCKKDTIAIHPLKMSMPGNLNFTEQFMKNSTFFIKTNE